MRHVELGLTLAQGLRVGRGVRIAFDGSLEAFEPGRPTSSLLDRGPLGQRRRILIVDDDADTRALYAWGLRTAGWFVAEAADGVEALQMAAALRPHAVVMDLCMPGLGGADAVVCLRLDVRTRGSLIIACSGLDRVRAEARALEAGCDAFVGKPCSPDKLCVTLEELAGRRAFEASPPRAR
jgi:CheY-like chemotaxis protein